MERFSKQSLRDFMNERRAILEGIYGFDPQNGVAQLGDLPQDDTLHRAYGEYETWQMIQDAFNL